jgi:single-strand DNA-binding protein
MAMTRTSNAPTKADLPRSEVVMVGRLGAVAEKTMPSGDTMLSFRVVVDRAPRDRGPHGRVLVDAIECSLWKSHLIKRLRRIPPDSLVEVSGPLRRRFFRSGQGFQSMMDVEVRSLRRLDS